MSATTKAPRPWVLQGAKLRRARRRAGISQENFAPMIGTTRRHVIRLENGEHRPNPSLLARIAEATGTDAGSFGYPSSDEDEEAASMNSALLDAVRLLVADELARHLQTAGAL